MIGTADALIRRLIDSRAKGNPTLEVSTRTRLILKGIDPAKFSATTPDDPAVIARIKQMGSEWGIQL